MLFKPHHLVREKFSIPVNKITVEDGSSTEVDETVFAELSTAEVICFVIKVGHDDGTFQNSLVLHCINSSGHFRCIHWHHYLASNFKISIWNYETPDGNSFNWKW